MVLVHLPTVLSPEKMEKQVLEEGIENGLILNMKEMADKLHHQRVSPRHGLALEYDNENNESRA
jgi:hypothetical protein